MNQWPVVQIPFYMQYLRLVQCWQKIVVIKTVYLSHQQSILLLKNNRRPVDFFVKL